MAQAVGSFSSVKNARDTFGGHLWGAIDYTGPTSYVQGGDSMDPHWFGFFNTIVALWGSADNTDTYFTLSLPVQKSTSPIRLVWYNKAGGEVAAGTNLSAVYVRLSAIGY